MDTKKLAVQRTMTPQCALQMRSAFGTDILMWRQVHLRMGRRSSTLPNKMREEDQKVASAYKHCEEDPEDPVWKTRMQEENKLK